MTILDRDLERPPELDARFGGRLTTSYASPVAIEELLPQADLVIGPF